MSEAAYGLYLFFLLYIGNSRCVNIQQSPTVILANSKNNTEIKCSYDDSGKPNMLWYQQKNTEMALIVLSYGATGDPIKEDEFTERFKLIRANTLNGALEISDLSPSDSAVYYCAVSIGGTGNPAYFGTGTKLTVLDPEIKVSTKDDINVTIIKPSEKQLCEKKVTLVCVARNFYPDHVNIKWKIGEEEVTDGVATDPQANEDGKTFTISSRLRVHTKQWRNPKNTFKCILKFYDGTKYLEPHAEINGIEGGGFTRENYVNSSNMMKLGYGVFIAKSGLYGIIICVFILTKGCSGKRMN